MKSLIVGNWKLYVRTLGEGKKLLRAIDKALPRGFKSDVVVCPQISLAIAFKSSYSGKRILFGTQDVFFENEGAHTGEVSPESLSSSGLSYVIVGHAEKRLMGETNETVSKKANLALFQGLSPIICVGEKERNANGDHFGVIEKDVTESLARIEPMHASRISIAYEPVWAIGASEAPASRVAAESIMYIRKTIADKWGRDRALKVRILYGGAVNDENAKAFANEKGIQGLLLGRASVDPLQFAAAVKAFG